jgi:hypothetical protein
VFIITTLLKLPAQEICLVTDIFWQIVGCSVLNSTFVFFRERDRENNDDKRIVAFGTT